MGARDRKGLFALIAAVVGAAALAAVTRATVSPARFDASLPLPHFEQDPEGRIRIEGTEVLYTLDGTLPEAGSPIYKAPLMPFDDPRAGRWMHTPSSVQWRHPIGTFDQAVVVRARIVQDGTLGPVATRTFQLPDHGALPVLSLVLPPGALFDPDTGLYVPGHAIFDNTNEATRAWPRSNKWWRYPGNYHGRGRDWERCAHLEVYGTNGPELSAAVGLRIHGNNTRGFPQHALRILFDKPGAESPLFGAEHGSGQRAILLRAAGNDQDHVFLRDDLQHRLCAYMPFETSASRQAVLYVNGEYWGLHNMRERIDDKEIARRHGLRAKEVSILADRLVLQEGDEREIPRFSRFLTMTERWDASAPGFVDSLERCLDVDGFLHYMAAQVVLGNTDWPEQNVKWWRFTGKADSLPGPRDGRWRYIMGDSDIGFGLATGPEVDPFARLHRSHAPTARLFRSCLRSETLRGRWEAILRASCAGPLASDRMLAVADSMVAHIRAEMPRHTRRWRRPPDAQAWELHVGDLMTFARERTGRVQAQWAVWKDRSW